ncbi:MAG: hypothetical protein KDH97_17720 [Calditrichaeota bacterium]|nr:hypothetical protein [Calditrichota bacterium]
MPGRQDPVKAIRKNLTPLERLIYSAEYSEWILKLRQLEEMFRDLRERRINPESHPPFVELREGFYARETFLLHRKQGEIIKRYGKIEFIG